MRMEKNISWGKKSAFFLNRKLKYVERRKFKKGGEEICREKEKIIKMLGF